MNIEPRSHDIYLFTRPPFELASSIAGSDWDEPLLRAAKANRVKFDKLHFTLVRLGSYLQRPDKLIPKFEKVGEEVANLPPSDVTLEWLGPLGLGTCVLSGHGRGIASVRTISRKGRSECQKIGLESGATSVPHVTLAYSNLGIGKRQIDPIKWRVYDFILVDSLNGLGKHVELNRWKFKGPDQLSFNL